MMDTLIKMDTGTVSSLGPFSVLLNKTNSINTKINESQHQPGVREAGSTVNWTLLVLPKNREPVLRSSPFIRIPSGNRNVVLPEWFIEK